MTQQSAAQTGLQHHQSLRRRVLGSVGAVWPWTIEARYAISGAIRRALKVPTEQDFRVVKFLQTERRGVFCDIGANRGQSIENFLMFKTDWTIIGFEPNPKMFAKAVEKFSGHPGVQLHNVGLAAEQATRTLYVPKYRDSCFDELASFDKDSALGPLYDGHLVEFDPCLTSFEELTCQIATLDSFRLSPDFVKIDVQGYEEDVLRGAWTTVTLCKPVLLIENGEISQAKNLAQLLSGLGYRHCMFDGHRLRESAFGPLNTFYMVPGFERGLERLF